MTMKRNCVLSLPWLQKLMVRCLVLLGLQLQLLPCVPGKGSRTTNPGTMSMENVCWYATQASWHFMLTVVAAYCRKFSAQLFTFPWSKSAKKCAIAADLHTIDNRLQKFKQQSNTKNFKHSQQIGQALLVPFSLFRAICRKLVFASNPQRRWLS